MTDLNIGAVVELTGRVLPAMVSRGHGAIITVASTAGLQPTPYMATYGATKAFTIAFTEALWAENRKTGVRILAVCPGMTSTEFFDDIGAQASGGQVQSPQQVVAEALRALQRRTPSVVTGRINRVLAFLPRLTPRWVTVAVAERMTRTPITPNHHK